jgi:hypothetical protein
MHVGQNTIGSNDGNHLLKQEQRSRIRRRSRGKAFALFVARPSLKAFRVTICDASSYGISFLHNVPLEPNTVLSFQLMAGKPGVSWVRTARVVHSTRQQEKWVIGCQVSPPFSDQELESL